MKRWQNILLRLTRNLFKRPRSMRAVVNVKHHASLLAKRLVP